MPLTIKTEHDLRNVLIALLINDIARLSKEAAFKTACNSINLDGLYIKIIDEEGFRNLLEPLNRIDTIATQEAIEILIKNQEIHHQIISQFRVNAKKLKKDAANSSRLSRLLQLPIIVLTPLSLKYLPSPKIVKPILAAVTVFRLRSSAALPVFKQLLQDAANNLTANLRMELLAVVTATAGYWLAPEMAMEVASYAWHYLIPDLQVLTDALAAASISEFAAETITAVHSALYKQTPQSEVFATLVKDQARFIKSPVDKSFDTIMHVLQREATELGLRDERKTRPTTTYAALGAGLAATGMQVGPALPLPYLPESSAIVQQTKRPLSYLCAVAGKAIFGTAKQGMQDTDIESTRRAQAKLNDDNPNSFYRKQKPKKKKKTKRTHGSKHKGHRR